MILHVDANSAYLSWTAAALLEKGGAVDLRLVPSVIGGSEKNRHGIVLAKSIPAKKMGVKTGETLFEARSRCPHLLVYPPDYGLYVLASDSMVEILRQYSFFVERYSIDECFLKWEGRREESVKAAFAIKERIKKELGFTVNVGVSTNKLLAKMASELKKPDMVHTLFKEEMEEKMWPLPVGDLFMVGKATERKLKGVGINTIGDLASADKRWLRLLLKSHGELVYRYANGIDETGVSENCFSLHKSVGNSLTTSYDVTAFSDVRAHLLGLSEQVGIRVRKLGMEGDLISVWFKTEGFLSLSHQRRLPYYTASTSRIYENAVMLIKECWKGQPLRQLGVSIGGLVEKEKGQISIWEEMEEKEERLNQVLDDVRKRYGRESIIRARFANSCHKPMAGGVGDMEYIMMGGYEI